MRSMRTLVVLALASSACLYGHEVVREPQAAAPPPPPPVSDSEPGYQTQAPPPPAGSEVADAEVFYSGLSPYGTWTFVAPYGRVWIPAVGFGWRPYYYGRWVLTDWGWTFASDDPWGWAAYHYGRWNWAVGFGWYWIPGFTWGPAWVSWRYGGGYAAWCPLGPRGVYFGYRHPGWVAVDNAHLTHPIARVALPPRAVAGVVTAAQPLTGPRAVARSGSFGPPVKAVQTAVGAPIARVPAAQVVGGPHAIATPSGAGPTRSPARPAPRPYGAPQARPGTGSSTPRPVRPYGGGAGRVTPRPYGGGGASPGVHPSGGGASGGKSAPAASSGSKGSSAHSGGKSK